MLLNDSLATFGDKLKTLRDVFQTSQLTIARLAGVKQYNVAKWEKGIYRPKKDISDAIARYFQVWHRWLFEDDSTLHVFMGTVLFRTITHYEQLRKLIELLHMDKAAFVCIIRSDTRMVLFLQRSGTDPSSFFIPVQLPFGSIEEILVPFVERSATKSKEAKALLVGLRKELDEPTMDRLLMFSSRKQISAAAGFAVQYDRGIILKPHGIDSRVISEDKIRSIYDSFVKTGASLDDIIEATRRYQLRLTDDVSDT